MVVTLLHGMEQDIQVRGKAKPQREGNHIRLDARKARNVYRLTVMDAIREQLIAALKGGQAHVDFEGAVKNFPLELRGMKPAGAPHTAWQLLEHLRIAQADILEFSRDAKYVAKRWPDDYWPATEAPPSPEAWEESIAAFEQDLKEFSELVADPKQDLSKPFAWGEGQTLLREALLVIDHNGYHLGQLVMLRVQLGIWPG